MQMRDDASGELRGLRRTLRELVALSTLPAVWAGAGREGIVKSLADVLAKALGLDLLYVRLRVPGEDDLTEVVRSRHRADADSHVRVVREALAPLLEAATYDSALPVPDPLGRGTLRTVVVRFGYAGDYGELVAGAERSDFPTESDRLLLGVGANQTAVVLQRKRAEQALRNEREWLAVTLASIGDAVIATDTAGHVVFLNGVAESLTGWPQAEAAGRPLEAVFPIFNEKTRRPAENPVAKALREGAAVALANHTVLVARDGTERPIDDSAAPIRDERGAVVGVVLIFRDVTRQREAERSLRESEHRYRTVLESVTDAFFALDRGWRFTYLNREAERLLGRTRDDLLGRSVWEEYPDVVGTEVERAYRRAANENVTVPFEIFYAPHGRWYEIQAYPSSEGLSVYFRDATGRKRAAEALAERARLAAMRADVSACLASGEPLRSVLQGCAETLVRHLDVAFARLWTLDDSGEVLELQASAGLYTHLDGPHSRMRVGEHKIGRIARDKQPLLTNAVPSDPNVSDHEWARREGMAAFAGYPLLVDGRLVGVLGMFARHALSEATLGDLAPLADGIAQYIERKRSTEALRSSEARKSAILDSALDAVITIDHAGRVVDFNPAAERTFGYPRAEIVGREMAEFVIPPALRDAHRRGIAQYLATGEGPILNRRIELTAVRADGTEFPVEAAIIPIAGAPPLFTGHLRDITERKAAEERLRRSEEQFRALAEGIPQLAWMARPDGHIFWYNRRWYEYTGASPEEMEGWGWQSVHDRGVLAAVLERWKGAIGSGDPFEMVFPLRGADGAFRPFLTRVVPVRDDRGNVTRWFGTNTDITERVRMEEALKDADRRKDEFLATLAHELRNPLAPIRMGLEVLRLGGDDPETVGEMLDTMEGQVRQMVRLIDDLLDVSRITRGKLELRKTRVDFNDVAKTAADTVRPMMDEGRHELIISLPPEPLVLDGDPARLSQVFSNLLNNAAKYTPEGGRVTLSAERQGSDVVVSVRDTGLGIPPEMLERVFEMFTQVDRTLERSHGGLGIGLHLVQRLVDLHGGSVEARSEGEGNGSEFLVRLPLVVTPAEPPRPTDDRTHSGRGRRILVADDNRDAADMLARVLKALGHEVVIAYDGEQAVASAESVRPEVCLFDIGMPKLSGYDAARAIRAEPWGEGMLLIALTGWGAEEDRRRSRDAGFDRHLVKPVEPGELREMLAELRGRMLL